MYLRYACSPQLESADGVRINRLRTAAAEPQINFHARNRLPVLVNNLAPQVGQGALRLRRTSQVTQNHECEKCAGADHPTEWARVHFLCRGSFRSSARFYSEWIAGNKIFIETSESVCLFRQRTPACPKSVRSQEPLLRRRHFHRGLSVPCSSGWRRTVHFQKGGHDSSLEELTNFLVSRIPGVATSSPRRRWENDLRMIRKPR